MNKNTMNCSVCRKKYDCKVSNGPDDWCTKFKSPIMRNVMWSLFWIGLFLLVLFLHGCTMLWTDDAFYCSVANVKQADAIVYDSNSVRLGLVNYISDPEKVNIVTPYGAGSVGE